MTAADFELRLADDSDVWTVLNVLSEGYGRAFTRAWFDWKHRSSPWGPSRCWIATDSEGPLGVVFGIPWKLSGPSGPIDARRLVDGSTTPRAQRRGVFRSVVRAELEATGLSSGATVVFATATPDAQAAHVKNGATALSPINFRYRTIRPHAARLTTAEPGEVPPFSDRLETQWDSRALIWRLDERSGVDATIWRLASAGAEHLVITRTVSRRGGRVLVVMAQRGHTSDVEACLRAVARKERAFLVLQPCGEGTQRATPRVSPQRGASLLCVWSSLAAPRTGLTLDDWSLCGLDLEGSI